MKDGPRWTNESMHKEEQVTAPDGPTPQKWRKDEQKSMVDKSGRDKDRRALGVGGWWFTVSDRNPLASPSVIYLQDLGDTGFIVREWLYDQSNILLYVLKDRCLEMSSSF